MVRILPHFYPALYNAVISYKFPKPNLTPILAIFLSGVRRSSKNQCVVLDQAQVQYILTK